MFFCLALLKQSKTPLTETCFFRGVLSKSKLCLFVVVGSEGNWSFQSGCLPSIVYQQLRRNLQNPKPQNQTKTQQIKPKETAKKENKNIRRGFVEFLAWSKKPRKPNKRQKKQRNPRNPKKRPKKNKETQRNDQKGGGGNDQLSLHPNTPPCR